MSADQLIHAVREDAINPGLAEFDRQLLRQHQSAPDHVVRTRAREIVRTTRHYLKLFPNRSGMILKRLTW